MSLLNRSPIADGDHHITGLRRIRQSNQAPTSSLVSGGSFINASGLLSQPPTAPGTRMNSLSLAPGSPLLGSYEDLARFPTESLHSFSFAQHSEDLLHSRQNIVKRGLDFMKDRLGMSTLGPGLLAQARLEGDEEAQQTMQLLQQANILSEAKTPMLTGPATGPADVQGNPFDRDFAFDKAEKKYDAKEDLREDRSDGASSRTGTNESTSTSKTSPPRSRGPTLRRTNTDIAVHTVKSQLNEALAKPYRAESSTSYSMLPSLGSTATLNGHAPRNGGTEAIFTTTAKFPWTILAANDMACLIFGVTKHEVRKIGILELVGEESREWLAERLQSPETTPFSGTHSQHGSSHATTSLLQNGEMYQNKIRRVRSTGLGNFKHQQNKSRGVLLCGDVVPIQKRNGNVGAASLWVKEKKGGLIWVVEEINEDLVTLELEQNIVKSVQGRSESIFGDLLSHPAFNGVNVMDLLPSLPQNVDFSVNIEEINAVQHYTACNRGIRIPCKIHARRDGDITRLKVTAFPHIAGIMVVSPTTLSINSTNTVFAAALFGQANPVGSMVTELLPYFGKILQYVVEEEQVNLVDGMVVPEHLFRKAYQSVALREGKEDPATLFYGPTGVPARHRDGSELRVDIQMRVAGSEGSFVQHENAIVDDSDDEMHGPSQPELVYAVWITYSRHFHAVSLARDASAPVLTRQMTPPRQLSPGQPSPPLVGSPGIEPTAAAMDHSLAAAMERSGTNTPSSAGEDDTISPIAQYMARKKKTIADFVILEDMGQGAYGQVKLARYKRGSRKRVVLKYVTKKRILVDTWTRDRKLGTVPLEIHVLNYLKGEGLKHPNIVEMTDFFEDDINYYIEMVPHGLPGMDLFDYIELKINMDEMEARSIFIQVVRAIHHLHTKAKVVHRDIKDENVVLDGNGRVKLIDFGSAAFIAKGPFDVFVGTIDYAAPEVLQGLSYRGKEQDIWALGVLLYTICYKENPFYNVDEIMDHEIRIPYLLSEPCLDLIRKMLDRDVDRRITIEEVIEHPWFDGLADMDEGLEMKSGSK
ncbi:Pkinase-domain-containing protein [Ascobolus immersus RN42]|uniref:non-specific serine/threonine protein kinase n=1 Tax=Ascobolus immersus RN42 TaxID=1160509 RepID=A0A3N4I7R2_ASCIM|nr:Pkinase-domain-containing protein [Ascobolus immersus RN42]